jgi:hypothetical protein
MLPVEARLQRSPCERVDIPGALPQALHETAPLARLRMELQSRPCHEDVAVNGAPSEIYRRLAQAPTNFRLCRRGHIIT